MSRPGWRDTVAAEWMKITSLRGTYVTLGLAVFLSIGSSCLVSAVVGATWHQAGARERAEFDPLLYPLVGSLVTAVALPLLGVKAISSEYSSGMMRLTLTATPVRGRLLAAKALVVGAVTLAAGLVTTAGMFAAGQLLFRWYGLETAPVADLTTLRVLGAVALLSPMFPLIGAALAVLVRGTAGALTSVLALIFLPGVIGDLLPSWPRRHLMTWLPGQAGDALALWHVDHDTPYLHPALAAVAVAGWLALFLGLAYLALTRRDA